MWSTVLSAFNTGLQGQTSRLMSQAEAFKDRTIEDARVHAVGAGVTVALVLFGLLFAAVAVGIGLVALYYAVSSVQGPLAGFAAAGGSALLISLAIFTVIAIRANQTPGPRTNLNAVQRETTDAFRQTEAAAASLGSRAQVDTLALGRQAVDAATGVVRDGSREAVLATLAATVVLGMLVGRRR